MRRAGWVGAFVFTTVCLFASLLLAETIVTTSGSVLQGQIEFGIPAVISVTSSTGDIFTVQRANLKAIRFPAQRGEPTTVETFDGNIIAGTVGGIPEVLGVRSASGDVQSVKLSSIQEIRFEPVAAAVGPTPASPVPAFAGPADALASQVKDLYASSRWGFTLGIDTGFQLGASTLNGFGYPTMTLGVSVAALGPIWRTYFIPSPKKVEATAREIAQKNVGITLDDLILATKEELPGIFLYLNVGAGFLSLAQIGAGGMFRIGPNFYFDLGLSFDLFWVIWPSIGFVIFF